MRSLALVILMLCATATALADKREWKDATVAKITAETSNGGAAVVPIGGILVGVPITHSRVFYYFETEDMTYILAWLDKKRPLNVTLHGKTKIALDKNGRDAHILDDTGKDVKLPISMKVAKPKQDDAKAASKP
jgi:hypothetical protein